MTSRRLFPAVAGRYRRGAVSAAAGILAAGVAVAAFNIYILPASESGPVPNGLPVVRPAAFTETESLYTGGRGFAEVKTAAQRLPFRRYLRVKATAQSPKAYNMQLGLPTAAPVRAGDMLTARFYLRRPLFSPSPARTDLIFERAGGDYRKSLSLPVEAGLRWRLVEARFKAAQDYPAGGAMVNFRLGFGPQEVHLAGFSLVNTGRKPGTAPALGVTYEGREKDSPWRAAAERRIDKLRKGGLRVLVTDASGKPLPGVSVRLRQTGHAFTFGAAINSKFLNAGNSGADKAKYRGLFSKLFNSGTIENDLKWPYWSGERKAGADKTAAWLRTNKLALRGHALVWPGWKHMPEGLEELKREPEKLRAAIRAHITEEAAYYKGKISEWDVLNEPLDNTDATALFNLAEIAEWFKLARKADPAAKLYLNECDILNDMGSNIARQEALKKLIRGLLAAGAPIDGLGLQCHFENDLTPPERLLAVLDRFAKLGMPIHATELSVTNGDEELQADYLRDFMTVLFSHPAAAGITLWTFWEGVHFQPLPALYTKVWGKKPAALALEELLLERWRTQLSGATGAGGVFAGRVFYGTYEIEVASGGKSKTVQAAVSKDSGDITVVLDPG